MRRQHAITITLVLVVTLALSCSQEVDEGPANPATDTVSDAGAEDEANAAIEDEPTYHGTIRDLVHRNCGGCHDPGGIGPFELDTYESLKAVSGLALNAIESGSMPPWQPDPDCRDFKDHRIMSDADREAFSVWVDRGLPEGDAAALAPVEQEDAESRPPDIRAKPSGPFTPTVLGGDDYRCFLLDAQFTQDTFVTRLNVDPGNRELVHHSNMFVIPPTHVPTIEALQDETSEPGYPCFGDAGVATINLIGAWVPGMEPIVMPDDYAVRIPAGSRIVMQTHFNSLYADLAEVDQEFQLWTRATPPAKIVRAMPLANLNFVVPAGEEASIHEMNVKYLGSEPLEVIGTAAHLHLLATQVKLEISRAAGEKECLLDIPQWDFNWQQAYFYEEDSWATVMPGETVRLTCTFDNSPDNQPIVDGARVMPQEVRWGGETFDEMCIAFMIVAEPYSDASQGDLCDPFKTCRMTCDDPFSVGCVFNCAVEEITCGECLVFAAQDCAARHCPAQLRAAAPCLFECAQGAQAGGDIDQCLIDSCPDERDELETCMRPALETGLCNEDLRACNVEL